MEQKAHDKNRKQKKKRNLNSQHGLEL